MDNYIIKRYENVDAFLKEAETYLYNQEVYNASLLSKLQESETCCQCSAVWDIETNTMRCSLVAVKDGFLYVSGNPGDRKDAYYVEILVKDFLSTSFPFKALFAYEPTLDTVTRIIQEDNKKKLKLMDRMWSHDVKKVTWSARSFELKQMSRVTLKQATLDEHLSIAVEFTDGFIKTLTSPDLLRVMKTNGEQMCRKQLDAGHIYILYCDDIPVSMAWKMRPLRKGCSIGFVYTPEEHRHKGYGGACVSLCTELFLETFEYVTIFIK